MELLTELALGKGPECARRPCDPSPIRSNQILGAHVDPELLDQVSFRCGPDLAGFARGRVRGAMSWAHPSAQNEPPRVVPSPAAKSRAAHAHVLPPKVGGTHVVGGPLLPVHGPGDVHPARHGVDAEDLHGGLVGAHACDTVPDGDVVVFVRPDLEGGAREETCQPATGSRGHAPSTDAHPTLDFCALGRLSSRDHS